MFARQRISLGACPEYPEGFEMTNAPFLRKTPNPEPRTPNSPHPDGRVAIPPRSSDEVNPYGSVSQLLVSRVPRVPRTVF
jgi:hypothetical protein